MLATRLRILSLAAVSAWLFCAVPQAHGYRLVTDSTNGGNPKISKDETYRVYIQNDPTNNNRKQEVADAIKKWKDALAARGVTVEVQNGEPPQQPLDRGKLNEEIRRYNEDDTPDPADYPEMAKAELKKNTISVYWETRKQIQQRRSGGAEQGLASTTWDGNNNVHSADIFLPRDPLGTVEQSIKKDLHNLTLHEFGHVVGLDHYTKSQTGSIMSTDPSGHDRLNLGNEETKGLNAIYGTLPRINGNSNAQQRDTSSLPSDVQSYLPPGMTSVWEYVYELEWLEGEDISYIQIETRGSDVLYAEGSDGLEDWLWEYDGYYFEFYADETYLGSLLNTGTLSLLSAMPPTAGSMVYSGGSLDGVTPTPVPASVLLGVVGLGLAAWTGRRVRSGSVGRNM